MLESEPDYVIITTGIPVADTGGDQEAKVGAQVVIDARHSKPYPGGSSIREYKWEIKEYPDEFNMHLPDSYSSTRFITFSAKYVGIYIFSLQVKDADGVESLLIDIKITVTGTRANPTDNDSDDDGIVDGGEVKAYGTDPGEVDTDDDGVQDGTEIGRPSGASGTNLNIFIPDADKGATKTDPLDSDSDDDGLFDGWEDLNGNKQYDEAIEIGEDTDINGKIEGDNADSLNRWNQLDADEEWTETSPNLDDSDEDGLRDGFDQNSVWGEMSTHIVGAFTIVIFGNKIYEFDGIEYPATIPYKADSDDDGLNDAFEIGATHILSNDEADVWNSIPIIEKPHPLKKDIYVEVDWMETCIKTEPIKIWFYEVGTKTTYTYHYFGESAKNSVINLFANAPVNNPDSSTGIRLHIDDGTGVWSGGGNLGVHINYLTEADRDAFYSGTYNSGTSNNGFDSKRHYIFRYSLLAHKIDETYLQSIFPGRDKDKFTGYRTGNKFMVFMANRITEDEVKHTFVHELGHTILGVIDGSGTGNDHQSSFRNSHCNQKTCVMYQASDGTREGEYWNFCNYCWFEMQRNGLEI